MKRYLLLAVVFVFMASTTWAYEISDVKNGGAIKGRIKVNEKIKDPVLQIKIQSKSDPKETEIEKSVCGESQQSQMYVISADGGVKNALVIVEDVTKGKAAPKGEVTIDNKKCYFEPLVAVAYKGGEYVIRNSDPILHNTNLGLVSQDKRSTVYNLALPMKDQVIKKPVRRTGMHHVKCDAHEWMRAYVYVSEHPYVSVTDANGSFEIKDLLPGKYKVKIWHEGLTEIVKEVEITAGKASELNVTLSKKQ